jgi:hypothetical protein
MLNSVVEVGGESLSDHDIEIARGAVYVLPLSLHALGVVLNMCLVSRTSGLPAWTSSNQHFKLFEESIVTVTGSILSTILVKPTRINVSNESTCAFEMFCDASALSLLVMLKHQLRLSLSFALRPDPVVRFAWLECDESLLRIPLYVMCASGPSSSPASSLPGGGGCEVTI